MSNKKNKLFLVHCVDTEGPLVETLNATFKRLKDNKNIYLKASSRNLTKLQNKEINLNGRENEIADYIHKKRITYLENWNEVGNMLKKISSKEFRMKNCDPYKNPYKFSWFVIDSVGYRNNPRKKTFGFHKIWDNFFKFVQEVELDSVGWHFHSVPANKNATEYNTSWTNNDWHEQSLCRRLIERKYFPSIFRAGGHIERIDLSFWLEQYIPFDFSCRSYDPKLDNKYESGDLNDWRGAPTDWSYYNPDFYDYRKRGDMNRTIFRTLDIDTNANVLSEKEVEKAFERSLTKPTILSVSTHDRRDMIPEIDYFMNLVKKVSKKFPEVDWRHSNAINAARKILNYNAKENLKLSLEIKNNIIKITSNKAIFGPSPFLAINELPNLFYRDNPTKESEKLWIYKIPNKRKVVRLGVAACDKNGSTSISVKQIK